MRSWLPVGFGFLMVLLVAVVILLSHFHFGLTYQVSPSMQKGFYWVRPAKNLKRGDIALFMPPSHTLLFLRRHHWIPNKGWMMKYIVGIPGDFVCQKDHVIWINHHKFAHVYNYYAKGKSLPNTHFCGKLKFNQYLLMSTKVKRSFDGRYFGPIDRKNIIGRVVPVF